MYPALPDCMSLGVAAGYASNQENVTQNRYARQANEETIGTSIAAWSSRGFN